MANQSIKAAFERLWQHTILALNDKANKDDIVQSDWNQTNETASDFINNKPEIITKEYIDEAISNVSIEVDATLSQEGKAADAKAVGDAIAAIEYVTATDDGNGIVTLNISSLQLASKEIF